MTAPMFETFAALLLAHVLADFVLAGARAHRAPGPFAGHVLLVFALSAAALGGVWPLALLVALAHMMIDLLVMVGLPARLRNGFVVFLADQTAHLWVLMIAAVYMPEAARAGLWGAALSPVVVPALVVSGLILTLSAGAEAVGRLTAPYAEEFRAQGLPRAGQMIGYLERGVIFLLLWIGQPAGIGFLIAAKSLLRLEAAKEQRASEYVIIGTLASFGWALAMGSATLAVIEAAIAARL